MKQEVSDPDQDEDAIQHGGPNRKWELEKRLSAALTCEIQIQRSSEDPDEGRDEGFL